MTQMRNDDLPAGRNPAGGDSLTGVVFDIQRFSLADGPGIRTTVFMKGCGLRCRWCQNPESFRLEPEIACRRDRCIDCGACLESCSRSAIRAGGGYRPDLALCNSCGACAGVCPTGARFIVGRRYTLAALLAEVQRDAVFYGESGGGVTISGGEATLQFEFVRAFLQACKVAGLNTAIETNGFTEWEKLAGLLPFLDHVYYDLKIISPAEHRQLTGADNTRILENARRLADSGAPVTFRVPLVSGMTSTETNVRALGDFLRTMGVAEIELCPYQNTWESKLAWLDTAHAPLGLPSLSQEQVLAVVASFAAQGIVAHYN